MFVYFIHLGLGLEPDLVLPVLAEHQQDDHCKWHAQ